MKYKLVWILGVTLFLSGCAADAPTPTVTVTATVTATAAPEPTPTPIASALVQQIQSDYPGYPVVVEIDSIDSRVASSYQGVTQIVALAPGLYTSYNVSVPDLDIYIDHAPVSGDCILKTALFPDRGGSCWDGVTAGSGEPGN